MFSKVITVCTGNICRSPAAEGLLRHYLQTGQPDVEVKSAGTDAMPLWQAASDMIDLLKVRGIDISPHRSRQLKEDLIRWADLILVMEEAHKKVVESRFPFANGKVFLLGKWENKEVPDPYRQSHEVFAKNVELIDHCVTQWIEKVWS